MYNLFAFKYVIDFITNKHDAHNIVSARGYKILNEKQNHR